MGAETPVQAVLACSQCGRTLPHSDLVQIAGNWVCAECKPAFLSRVMASGGTAVTSKWHYGGFWIRVAAKLLDGIVIWSAQACIALLFFGTLAAQFMPSVMRSAPLNRRLGFQLVSWAIIVTYETVFLRYKGATLGKMALGLKVVRSNGAPLGWGVSIGRYFMYLVSAFTLLIGYIMAGFDDEKRALHDRVCDTRVVYKRSLA